LLKALSGLTGGKKHVLKGQRPRGESRGLLRCERLRL